MSNLTPIGLIKLRSKTTTPARTPFAVIVDTICIRENTTQAQLSELIEIDYSMISHMRAGRRHPSQTTVLDMISRWPITEDEKVAICQHFRVIPPGYYLMRSNATKRAHTLTVRKPERSQEVPMG